MTDASTPQTTTNDAGVYPPGNRIQVGEHRLRTRNGFIVSGHWDGSTWHIANRGDLFQSSPEDLAACNWSLA